MSDPNLAQILQSFYNCPDEKKTIMFTVFEKLFSFIKQDFEFFYMTNIFKGNYFQVENLHFEIITNNIANNLNPQKFEFKNFYCYLQIKNNKNNKEIKICHSHDNTEKQLVFFLDNSDKNHIEEFMLVDFKGYVKRTTVFSLFYFNYLFDLPNDKLTLTSDVDKNMNFN